MKLTMLIAPLVGCVAYQIDDRPTLVCPSAETPVVLVGEEVAFEPSLELRRQEAWAWVLDVAPPGSLLEPPARYGTRADFVADVPGLYQFSLEDERGFAPTRCAIQAVEYLVARHDEDQSTRSLEGLMLAGGLLRMVVRTNEPVVVIEAALLSSPANLIDIEPDVFSLAPGVLVVEALVDESVARGDLFQLRLRARGVVSRTEAEETFALRVDVETARGGAYLHAAVCGLDDDGRAFVDVLPGEIPFSEVELGSFRMGAHQLASDGQRYFFEDATPRLRDELVIRALDDDGVAGPTTSFVCDLR